MAETLYRVIYVVLLHRDKRIFSIRKFSNAELGFFIPLCQNVLLFVIIQYAYYRGIHSGGKRSIDAAQLFKREGNALLAVAADSQVNGHGRERSGQAVSGDGKVIAFFDIFVNQDLRVAVDKLCYLLILGRVIDGEGDIGQINGHAESIADG